MTGKRAETKNRNEQEAQQSQLRDRAERERDIANYRDFGKDPPAVKRSEKAKPRRSSENKRTPEAAEP
jgi:hypothetical protein